MLSIIRNRKLFGQSRNPVMNKYDANDPYLSDPQHYSVYVIELSDDVGPRLNPDFPSVYVGQTSIRPRDRFDQHKSGYRSSRKVRLYGIRLLPSLYRHINPLFSDEREEAEVDLAEQLRALGYTVYGGH